MSRERTVPDVGRRIRAIREQRGLSLRALAERSGLSINAISLIERGENSPTVASLHALAQALHVSITAFFEEATEQTVIFVPRDNRMHTQRNGMRMESLGSGLRSQQIEPFVVTLEVNTGSETESITHAGQEFVHCLTGEVEYWVGGQCFRLAAGDSLLFEAVQPHHFRNVGASPASLLLVFQSATGGETPGQNHFIP